MKDLLGRAFVWKHASKPFSCESQVAEPDNKSLAYSKIFSISYALGQQTELGL